MDATSVLLRTYAPSIVITETQKVGCPYCVPGYCEVTAVKKGAGMEIPGFKDPQKCVECKRFFKLVPIVQVKGEAIEGE